MCSVSLRCGILGPVVFESLRSARLSESVPTGTGLPETPRLSLPATINTIILVGFLHNADLTLRTTHTITKSRRRNTILTITTTMKSRQSLQILRQSCQELLAGGCSIRLSVLDGESPTPRKAIKLAAVPRLHKQAMLLP